MLAGQRWFIQTDLGHRESIKEHGALRGRDLNSICGESGHGGPGLISPAPGPEVKPGQPYFRKRSELLLGLIENWQRLRSVARSFQEPGESEPVRQALGIPGLAVSDKQPGRLPLFLGSQQVDT